MTVTLLCLLFIAGLIYAVRRGMPTLPHRTQKHFAPKRSLMSEAEKSLFNALSEAFPHYRVMAQVRLPELIDLVSVYSQRLLYAVTNKSIDFVLMDPATGAPVVAIELDDSSHLAPERIQRDMFVNSLFDEAGMPLCRLPVCRSYKADKLRAFVSRGAAMKKTITANRRDIA